MSCMDIREIFKYIPDFSAAVRYLIVVGAGSYQNDSHEVESEILTQGNTKHRAASVERNS